ncbi:preprotein translocase subunit SecY [Paludicola sp. MB14-C6]|uniref:preprotein translocase subunit SecY n=1 Tax=Paludihabitans sp. MB14-C6 TaxID=3070656 RepID=UPI0027DCA469|nr:preprotein translocase subunit SecY [Paludicola sp. MB14-C6]WMJ24164.1 preprotein translocase subunit SecY [Paludicola sp. MB14-C6]
MFTTIRNAFKNDDLRKRIIYTIFILIIFRLGSAVIAPFIDGAHLSQQIGNSTDFLGLLNTFSGGAFEKASIFALNIQPYITASIIVQLLAIAIPALERLSKEGETGRKKLNKITKYVTVGMCLLQGYAYYTIVRAEGAINAKYLSGFPKYFALITIILSLTAGASVVTWLGDQITEKGIGNGISIILFANIISRLPQTFDVLWKNFMQGGKNFILVPIILLIFAGMIVLIIVMNEGERRIPVAYAKRVVGRKMYGGQNSHIPIKVSMSGVMPIIFASSLVSLPGMIARFANPKPGGFWYGFLTVMSPSHWFYGILYFLLIIGFNYFYVAVQYNPIEIANNIKSNNGAIPGIRPGKPTSTFIAKVIAKITFIGALFLGFIAIFPIIFNSITSIPVALGGTSIIIIVGVALDTMRQLESQLMMRHHKGFLE